MMWFAIATLTLWLAVGFVWLSRIQHRQIQNEQEWRFLVESVIFKEPPKWKPLKPFWHQKPKHTYVKEMARWN